MQHGEYQRRPKTVPLNGCENFSDWLMFLAYAQDIEDALDGKIAEQRLCLIDPYRGELPKAIRN